MSEEKEQYDMPDLTCPSCGEQMIVPHLMKTLHGRTKTKKLQWAKQCFECGTVMPLQTRNYQMPEQLEQFRKTHKFLKDHLDS